MSFSPTIWVHGMQGRESVAPGRKQARLPDSGQHRPWRRTRRLDAVATSTPEMAGIKR